MILRLFLAVAGLLIAGHLCCWAGPLGTEPVEGLREHTPAVFALTGGRIVVSPGKTIEGGTLVLRDGVITAVGENVEIPKDAKIQNVSGKTLYAGFIESYSEAESALPEGGAPNSNSNVPAQVSVAATFQPSAETSKNFRSMGVALRLVAPSDGIIKGTSALVTTGEGAGREVLIRQNVAQHLKLTPRGGRESFPGSPMGAVALVRQTMIDADWYVRANAAARGDSTLGRVQKNDSLAALADVVTGKTWTIIDASNDLYALRADHVAREFGLKAMIRGSGFEYRSLEAIAQTRRPLIVPVDFPQPPNVATAESARLVPLKSLMHWDIAPENPARLQQAGVTIALTSFGLKDQMSFLKQVRKAVERGLPAEEALRAITTTPARLFGISEVAGTLEVGKAAHLVVASDDLFGGQGKVLETWVDGRRYEIESEPLLDPCGQWRLTIAGEEKPLTVFLAGSPQKLSGKILPPGVKKKEDEKAFGFSQIGLQDARLSGTFKSDFAKRPGVAQLSAVVVVSDQEASWTGRLVWPDGSSSAVTAVRTATHAETSQDKKDEEKKDSETKNQEKQEPKKEGNRRALYEVNFPFGAYGRNAPPAQPQQMLFRGATVWTCGEQGILESADVLIGEGKILAVGKNLSAPKGAEVIDARGKHLTPGIIDCHSHMATDGGINEATQAITAEVRIGDFIDPTDITIYRQLAGGVTTANVLHGSANPIGGQNQVIKLRWGALGEDMKFEGAPAGIKFALGENVKQSNWGERHTTRYPQTRMGVEQIMRDAFLAAAEYQKRHEDWRQNHRGLPPRRDLELECLAEILAKKRWIHCHSYRQDEILALLRLLEEFDVTIGTLQHILEGYKVADAMQKHGAMGSTFADWWAYKFEVYDAIPYNGAIMHNSGVNVSFNSDDWEMGRRLNQEAAKAMKYGNVPAEEALKFITINPAMQLRIENEVGSIAPGKHADLALWSGPPLSALCRCEQTWIDGRKYFDLQEDARERIRRSEMRAALIQRILTSGESMRPEGELENDGSNLWPRFDEFCTHGGHGHDH